MVDGLLDAFEKLSGSKYRLVTWYVYGDGADRDFMDSVVRPAMARRPRFCVMAVASMKERPRDVNFWYIGTTAHDLWAQMGNGAHLRVMITKQLAQQPPIQIHWFNGFTLTRLTALTQIGKSAKGDKTKIQAQLKRAHDKVSAAHKITKRHRSLDEGLRKIGAVPLAPILVIQRWWRAIRGSGSA